MSVRSLGELRSDPPPTLYKMRATIPGNNRAVGLVCTLFGLISTD